MRLKLAILLLFSFSFNINYAQIPRKKIGLALHVYGPLFFTTNIVPINGNGSLYYDLDQKDSLKEGNKFKDFHTFFKQNIRSPYKGIVEKYKHILDSLNREMVIVDDKINDKDSFPIFQKAQKNNSYFLRDLTGLKQKYDIDTLVTLTIRYGIELEKSLFVNLDKRSKFEGKIMLIDLNTNKIESVGRLNDVKNIPNWNQPPNYPTLVYSFQQLIEEKMYPTLEKKLLNDWKGKKML